MLIYTWGKARRKYRPEDSEKNFSVAYRFKCKPKGVNLKKVNGRMSIIQTHIRNQKNYKEVMNEVIKDIEAHDYEVISISCEHGKHRSVAFAELLKKELENRGWNIDVKHMHLR